MIKLFRRKPKPPKPISEEELARRLTAPGYRCATTGEVVDAPNAVRLRAPFGWPDPPPPLPDDHFDKSDVTGDVLTESYARRDRDWLVRASLPIPVQATDGHVFLSVWCSLSPGNFVRFRSSQTRGDADGLGDMFSWLYSRLPPTDGPLLTKGVLVPQPGGLAPVYWITDEKHPLYGAQQGGGMSASDVVALYEALGCADVVAQLRA